MNATTVQIAAEAHYVAMQREFVRRNPTVPWPFPVWPELDQETRTVWHRIVIATLKAAEPANVQAVLARRADSQS